MMPLHNALRLAARRAKATGGTFHVVECSPFSDGFAFALPTARPTTSIPETVAQLQVAVTKRLEANVAPFTAIHAVLPSGQIITAKRDGTVDITGGDLKEKKAS